MHLLLLLFLLLLLLLLFSLGCCDGATQQLNKHGALPSQFQSLSSSFTRSSVAAAMSAGDAAAAAAWIADKGNIFKAAESGNMDIVKAHVIADASCVHKKNA
jgi:hypothetical protein